MHKPVALCSPDNETPAVAISFYRGIAGYYFCWLTRLRALIFAPLSRGDILRRFLLWASYSGLVAIGVKIIAALWFYFAWVPDLTPADSPAPGQTAHQAAAFDAQGWQRVYEQNWFGQQQPAAPEQTAPVAETRLHIVLRGIAWGAHPAAVIEESGQQQMYREGDALASYTATVGEIFRDYLLLYYQGETERLSLADSETDRAAADHSSVDENNSISGDLLP